MLRPLPPSLSGFRQPFTRQAGHSGFLRLPRIPTRTPAKFFPNGYSGSVSRKQSIVDALREVYGQHVCAVEKVITAAQRDETGRVGHKAGIDSPAPPRGGRRQAACAEPVTRTPRAISRR